MIFCSLIETNRTKECVATIRADHMSTVSHQVASFYWESLPHVPSLTLGLAMAITHQNSYINYSTRVL